MNYHFRLQIVPNENSLIKECGIVTPSDISHPIPNIQVVLVLVKGVKPKTLKGALHFEVTLQ